MEQVVGKDEGQETGDRETSHTVAGVHKQPPTLKELDRLRLERLNLAISNINLQLVLLNERARALQMEMAGIRAEREGMVKQIMESIDCVAGNMESSPPQADVAGNGKWRLNPDSLNFELFPPKAD